MTRCSATALADMTPQTLCALEFKVGFCAGGSNSCGNSCNVTIRLADLEALSAVLGDKPYFLGEKFTSVDCTAFGHLVLITDMLYGEPFKQAIEANPALHNLKAYVARVKEAYWSDWDERVAGK